LPAGGLAAVLDAYLTATRNLLQNPTAPTALYADANLTTYVNTARGQLAGEAECIRYMATIDTVAGQSAYDFADLDTGVSATNGIQGVVNIRAIWYGVGAGRRWIPPRPWEWFSLYTLNDPVPQENFPVTWSQFAQGAAPGSSGAYSGGSFYINAPDQAYTLYCDCVCYPNALAADNEPEAIPYLWTDAVPWYAAAYALWSSQTNARAADAERYFNTYNMFVERARKATNPSVGRWQYSQSADPVQAAKLQIRGGG
jgi:hypothetical protein